MIIDDENIKTSVLVIQSVNENTENSKSRLYN